MSNKKVCVLGTAQRSLYDAYYNDPEWDIWATGTCYTYYRDNAAHLMEHVNRFFEVHHDYVNTIEPDYAGFIEANKDRFVTSENYPLVTVQDYFGMDNFATPDCTRTFNYFTSTISYMVALAIVEGYQEIAIFGVDMSADGEYMGQRPSAEFFIGYARGAGIKVIIPDNCDMLKTGVMYGIEQSLLPVVFGSKYNEIIAKQAQVEENIIKYLISGGGLTDGMGNKISGYALLHERIFMSGALDVAKYYAKQWGHLG